MFKTYNDLSHDIKHSITKVPEGTDLVVGIPRSGMFPAHIISQILNISVMSLDEFCAGIPVTSGKERGVIKDSVEHKKVFIIDDASLTGESIKLARDRIETAKLHKKYDISYGTVYKQKDVSDKNLIFFEEQPLPVLFQWNYLNHVNVTWSIWDIDGLICADPTKEQDDGGSKYKKFIKTARPLSIPNKKILALCTSRPEKYRSETVKWLDDHGVKYGELFMMKSSGLFGKKNDTFAQRAKFKSQIYEKTKDARFFYESDPAMAAEISIQTGRPVFCTTTDELF